jgi:hypothetical protein
MTLANTSKAPMSLACEEDEPPEADNEEIDGTFLDAIFCSSKFAPPCAAPEGPSVPSKSQAHNPGASCRKKNFGFYATSVYLFAPKT